MHTAGLGFVSGTTASFAPTPSFAQSTIDDFVASDLEVLTVTPTSVTISWTTRSPGYVPGIIPTPVPVDSRVFLGPIDGKLQLVHEDSSKTPTHIVEIDGLEPGRTYRFEAWSGGQKAEPGLITTSIHGRPERAGVFTTLVPPEGSFLGTIALSNDSHVGEQGQGGMIGAFPPPIRQEEGLEPYTEVMFTGMLNDLRSIGSPYLLVAGDLTEGNYPEEALRCREMLDSYGAMGTDWMAIRGNHDRPRKGKAFRSASPVSGHPGYHDAFGDLFVPWRQIQSEVLPSGLRVVGLDTTMRDLSGGDLDDRQFDQFASILMSDPERPTIVMNHHPVTTDAAWTNASGPIFVMDWRNRKRIQKLELNTPGVFFHLTGHTHRMRVNKPDFAESHVEYLENASTTTYPGGYSLLHLYTGGYQVNFQRVSTEQAERWCYRSRWTTFGLLPEYTLGQLSDRNHVRKADLSGLKPFGQTDSPINTVR